MSATRRAVESAADLVLATAAVRELCTASPHADAHERAARIRALEALKSVCAAVQAAESVALAAQKAAAARASQRQQDNARRSVTAEIALARRESSFWASRHLGMAEVLINEMPHSYAALAEGRISEHRAMLIVQTTATLTRESRETVDAELADRIDSMSDKQLEHEAFRIGYRLDPHLAMKRIRQAEHDRRVTVRPHADGVVQLTALLPLVHGVSVYAALDRCATNAKAAGDLRSRGQLMADELVSRITAEPTIDSTDTVLDSDGVPTVPAGTQLTINLVMTDRTLLDGDSEPAVIGGHGAIPAPLARAGDSCTDHGQAMGSTALPPPRHRRSAHHGRPKTAVPRRRTRIPGRPGPVLPNTVVWSTHQAHRPHQALRQGWKHRRRQRTRPLRVLQLPQGG